MNSQGSDPSNGRLARRHDLDHAVMMRELQRQQRALAGTKLAVCGLALLSAIALSLVLMALWPA